MTEATEKCTKCKGRGYWHEYTGLEWMGAGPIRHECKKCNGTGRVRKRFNHRTTSWDKGHFGYNPSGRP